MRDTYRLLHLETISFNCVVLYILRYTTHSSRKHFGSMANKVSVINPSYSVPQSITIQINTEKGVAYSETDDRLFYIEDTFFTLHDRRVLYDNTKNPIVTFYNKVCFLIYST